MTRQIAVILLVAGVGLQASQPPSPSKGNTNRQAQETGKSETRPTQPGQDQRPVVVNVTVPEPKTPPPAAKEGADYYGTVADWWMVGLTLLTLGATVALVVVAVRQFIKQTKQTTKALALARQANRMADKTFNATLDATRQIERAYILVRFGCPGIDENGNARIKVINTGNTPATVTDISMFAVLYPNIQAVPDTPNYEALMPHIRKDGAGSRVFLVKGEDIAMPFGGQKPEFTAAENDASLVLVMFGFVDYIDRFDVRHRCGFGRFFVAERNVRDNYQTDEAFRERLNLGFLPKPGYNYDRVRVRGEGSDWDDKAQPHQQQGQPQTYR